MRAMTWSWSLLVDVSFDRPNQLFIGQIDWTNLKSEVDWKRLTKVNELPTERCLTIDFVNFKTPDNMEFEVIAYSTISQL